MDQKKTGMFLKQLRNEKNMTQEQLARHFNVSNRSVSRWETGSNLPDISLLVEIADFYDVDVREIIDGERKSEMMDKEIREVAGKMADYSNSEKDKHFTWLQIGGALGVFFTLSALILQILSYEPDLRRAGAVLGTFIVLVIMAVITLYAAGVLQRIAKHKKAVQVIKIITIVMLAVGLYYLISGAVMFGLLYLSVASAKIEVSTDPAEYNTYIHNPDPNTEHSYANMEEFGVLPEAVGGLNVREYSVTYYNPWDPQYVVYMTVDYDEAEYAAELERLGSIGIDTAYTGYYSVTGEPEGYDLIAMDCDDYHGFVYAMIPEDSNGNTKITYVALWFCNYAYDLDVHQYIPDRYLLPGFDATEDNPYGKACMENLK